MAVERGTTTLRFMVIANPRAGRGRGSKIIPVVREFLASWGLPFDIRVTEGPGEATRYAHEAALSGYDVVVAAGGDGTVNEVANGIMGKGTILGVIPCGTGNDFALSLGISKDPVRACRTLVAGCVARLDIGRVLDRYFVSSVGVGFDGTVAKEANRSIPVLRGAAVYVLALLKVLLTYAAPRMRIRLDHKSISLDAQLVAITNAPTYGGGMRIAPEAIMDDGMFEVCIMERMGSLETLYHLPKVFKGTHVRLPKVKMYRAKEIWIESDRTVPLHMDGEVTEASALHFEIRNQALPVIIGRRDRLARQAPYAAPTAGDDALGRQGISVGLASFGKVEGR
ncbi:MAG TPA: diacylglycerol kinase family lipid kinase [Firmicutes bacterium]|nr:diacylglycerol kinase family lipid kinase [Bacillota bacterium]